MLIDSTCAPFGAGVVEALHHGAGGEADHPVGDANRDDFCLRRAADEIGEARPTRRCPVEPVAGQQAQRARAVAAIGGQGSCRRMIGRIVRARSRH